MSEPAYTPMGTPVRCMTPGHEDREARLYPGGRLCKDCLPRKTATRGGPMSTTEQTKTQDRQAVEARLFDPAWTTTWHARSSHGAAA